MPPVRGPEARNGIAIDVAVEGAGADDGPDGKVIRADVPLAEMFGYATPLRSMSQGRAVYSREFEKYSEVPQSVAKAVGQ